MYGWHLKILRVNLTTKKVTQEDVDPKIARDYLGGRGCFRVCGFAKIVRSSFRCPLVVIEPHAELLKVPQRHSTV